MNETPHEEAAGPPDGGRPPYEMRLRSRRAPVTRLSRKVLLGLGTVAAIGIGGALVPGSPATAPDHRVRALQHQQSKTPDGLANLPRDYTGLPKAAPQLGPPLPGDLGRPIANAGAPAARHADAGGRSNAGATAHCPGTGGGAHQQSLRDNQCRTGRPLRSSRCPLEARRSCQPPPARVI